MSKAGAQDDIAIIGMSCRVAGAQSPSQLWDVLASSQNLQKKISRFNMDSFYHIDGGPRKGMTNVEHAYMLEDDTIDRFDHAFFHTTPVEAASIDPQQRMLLEVAYEAVENAGHLLEDFQGTDTAVFAGMDSCDYHSILSRDIEATPRYLATGTATCMAANRISYFFNLSGASMAIDTACSSTMAALHQAVTTLQRGDSSMALVCGAKLILTPDMFMPSSELGFLSPTGICHSFDAAGDGYARGEGVLALLIKPLQEAQKCRDPIRGVIKAVALNQDGRTQGITLPSAEAQRQNMIKLYQKNCIDPGSVQYLEAHGTGTSAGDPLEFTAINSVFSKPRSGDPLVVGSIKSNIGHLEACAALAGIIKTVLCLEKHQIPPQMHFNTPNPKIDFQAVRIPKKLTDWPEPRPGVRCAAVNTFGAGGTNGHAVLEEYITPPPAVEAEERLFLFKVSAADQDALQRLSLQYASYLEDVKPNIRDLAHTLLSRRSLLRHAYFFTAKDLDEARSKLQNPNNLNVISSDKIQEIVAVFSGQGAQWPQMGKELLEQSELFKATIADCEQALNSLEDGPQWSLSAELMKLPSDANVYQARFSQPLCTAVQLGLVTIWRSWGIEPKSVVGHSSGEIAAAYMAGFISLRDAIIIAYYRGLYVNNMNDVSINQSPQVSMSMCAIGASKSAASDYLQMFPGLVDLAAVNSPESCTLSGEKRAIQKIVKIATGNGIFCRELKIDIAYHSRFMLTIAKSYERALVKAGISNYDPTSSCIMFSSVTGEKLRSKDCTARYWRENMVSTVLFSLTLAKSLSTASERSAILEIGPHPALNSPIRELLRTLEKDSVPIFHSCFRGRNAMDSMLSNAGAMIASQVKMKISAVNARVQNNGTVTYGNVLKDMPSYTWNHSSSIWSESRISRRIRFRQFPHHELLGSRYLDDLNAFPSWRNLLVLKEVPWLLDLKENDPNTEMPISVYLLMALEAGRQLYTPIESHRKQYQLSDVIFINALPLSLFSEAETVIELHFNAEMIQANSYRFTISSLPTNETGSALKHVSGIIDLIESLDQEVNIGASHDQEDLILADRLREIDPDFDRSFETFQVSDHEFTGTFEPSNTVTSISISSPAFNAILNLPVLQSLVSRLPRRAKISSIGQLNLQANCSISSPGIFSVHKLHGRSHEVQISSQKELIFIRELRLLDLGSFDPGPKLGSLFYQSAVLPDITLLPPTESIELPELLELVSHRWPHCDIGLCQLEQHNIRSILGYLRKHKRRRFRSIQVICQEIDISPEQGIQVSKNLDLETKLHLVIAKGDIELASYMDLIHPRGLLCLESNDTANETSASNSFEKVALIRGFEGKSKWVLWRRHGSSKDAPERPIRIFSPVGINTFGLLKSHSGEAIDLERNAIIEFCQIQTDPYDAVIIDSEEKSLIATWPGDQLMPLLQHLLKLAKRIIWITQKDQENPFVSLAGITLRTLQSEKPSLQVTWLNFQASDGCDIIREAISRSLSTNSDGNEVQYDMINSVFHIKRYLPDDELSALNGMINPVLSSASRGRCYEVGLKSARSPEIIVSNDHSLTTIEPNNEVSVKILASVIDEQDIQVYERGNTELSGRFFGGMVVSRSSSLFEPGQVVIGWQKRGSKSNSATVPHYQLYKCDDPNSVVILAAHFAAMCTALAIVDGNARARTGDTFRLNFTGILREAIEILTKDCGAQIVTGQRNVHTDFTVVMNPADRITVNQSRVDIERYLSSLHGSDMINKVWANGLSLVSRPNLTDLSQIKDSFQNGTFEAAYSNVIIHDNLIEAREIWATYTPARSLFTDGAYVVVGGLGGLGRYVLTWMAQYGAQNIFVISRTGLQSKEAKETFEKLNTVGISLKVIKADACDADAMENTLSSIRQQFPIKGVLNLAVILGDAPLASMTGIEWDRALQLKIQSSWILHEKTLEDNLEFFVMFSSIASVLGNRNQAGYNVGNGFLNALTQFRRSIGRCGVSIGLGAMTDIGILHDLKKGEAMLQTLTRSGLTHLQKHHLGKILEAAINESHNPYSSRSFILTGLEMFERVDGKLIGSQDQTMLYWTELPEFGFLQSHRKTWDTGQVTDLQYTNLRDGVVRSEDVEARSLILDAFINFLATLLGYKASSLDSKSPLVTYGIDSLTGVSCQYWFHRELDLDVKVPEILGAKSFEELVGKVYDKLKEKTQ